MLLSEIVWSRHNKDSERSQILYRGQDVYLLIRTFIGGAGQCAFHYALYRDGSMFESRADSPSEMLADLHHTKMTPLEYKCWQLKQKR